MMTKILIVDDIKAWQDYHKQVLKNIYNNAEFYTADCAKDGYQKLLEHNNSPFDIIITDLQMELDFEPKHAGEWFVEQIKELKNYYRTKIIIISGTSSIRPIAENLNVDCIPKSTAVNFPEAYDSVLL